jgi:hypothetical protein
VNGQGTDFDQYILVDHIPHNDAGGGDFSNPKSYLFNLTLPDISWSLPAFVCGGLLLVTELNSGLCVVCLCCARLQSTLRVASDQYHDRQNHRSMRIPDRSAVSSQPTVCGLPQSN